jgi:hypothetical protein
MKGLRWLPQLGAWFETGWWSPCFDSGYSEKVQMIPEKRYFVFLLLIVHLMQVSLRLLK